MAIIGTPRRRSGYLDFQYSRHVYLEIQKLSLLLFLKGISACMQKFFFYRK
ncbi:hypothetical protein HMPREF3213_02422 [Heyndrickxia coagulans]|uniref:Uncharacterized protein n=1 Tax=Heyndrickxia coagulans TaxID=1398 RepID=A0A133KK84_HEYCO|nr:hypothetical protein HMPREF3213_02422 [Heyndrickxia coagulans]